jgi:hypothetical protein
MKVVRLSALRIDRLYPPGNIPATHFCYRLGQSPGHSAAERAVSIKNSNDTIGNRTRDLPACSAVPQPNAPPRVEPHYQHIHEQRIFRIIFFFFYYYYYYIMLFLDVISCHFIPVLSLRLALRLLCQHINLSKPSGFFTYHQA